MNRIKFNVLGGIALLLFSACSSSDSSSGSAIDGVPQLAPIVDSAAPTALKAGTSSSFLFKKLNEQLLRLIGIKSAMATPTDSDIKTQLQSIFKGTYGKISGGNGTGYINALLEDLDSRMAELKSRFSGKTLTCMQNASKTFTIDLSSIHSVFTLPLDVQCKDTFGGSGDQSASGSGMVFGKSSSGDYSLWLGLNHSTTSGFGYAAKVSNPDSAANKTVNMIFVEGEEQYGRGTISRLKAQPGVQKYELVYRSTSPNGISPLSGGSSTSLGYAVDLISDGSLIYVQGKYWSPGQTCSAASTFTSCLNASDLSTATSSCTSLSASFTMASASALSAANCPTIPTPSTSEKTLFNAIQISSADGSTSSDRD